MAEINPTRGTETGWMAWIEKTTARPDVKEFAKRIADRVGALYVGYAINAATVFSVNSQPIKAFSEDILAIVKKRIDRETRKAKAVVSVDSRVKTDIKMGDHGPEVLVHVQPLPKSLELKPKEYLPNRYFEIHGPGGRVKVTTDMDVMRKAKKQGIHVEMKYKMPTGKAPVRVGFYEMGLETESSRSRRYLNKRSPEFRAAKDRLAVNLQQALSGVQRWNAQGRSHAESAIAKAFGIR